MDFAAKLRIELRMKSKNSLYDYPRYYEIAFSFRDIKQEIDFFEECFRRY